MYIARGHYRSIQKCVGEHSGGSHCAIAAAPRWRRPFDRQLNENKTVRSFDQTDRENKWLYNVSQSLELLLIRRTRKLTGILVIISTEWLTSVFSYLCANTPEI